MNGFSSAPLWAIPSQVSATTTPTFTTLTVTGASSLDNGAITTNGAGGLSVTGITTAQGGFRLPTGAVAGDYLGCTSSVNGNAAWGTFAAANVALNTTTTLNATWTGPGTSSAQNVVLYKVGNIVNCRLSTWSVASTVSTSFLFGSTVPVGWRPIAQLSQGIIVQNNTVFGRGVIQVTTGGGISLFTGDSSANFTGAGTAGVGVGGGEQYVSWAIV